MLGNFVLSMLANRQKKLYDDAVRFGLSKGYKYRFYDGATYGNLFGLCDLDRDGQLEVLLNFEGEVTGEFREQEQRVQHIWWFRNGIKGFEGQEVFVDKQEIESTPTFSVVEDEVTGERILRIDNNEKTGDIMCAPSDYTCNLFRLISGSLTKVLMYPSSYNVCEWEGYGSSLKFRDGLFYVNYSYCLRTFDPDTEKHGCKFVDWQNIYKPDSRTGKGILQKGQQLADFQKRIVPAEPIEQLK